MNAWPRGPTIVITPSDDVTDALSLQTNLKRREKYAVRCTWRWSSVPVANQAAAIVEITTHLFVNLISFRARLHTAKIPGSKEADYGVRSERKWNAAYDRC
jgi:hypothetical protein